MAHPDCSNRRRSGNAPHASPRSTNALQLPGIGRGRKRMIKRYLFLEPHARAESRLRHAGE